MMNTIVITIDRAGRIVVPKVFREQIGLDAGTEVEVRCRDGIVELAPAPREVRVVKKGRVAVAEAVEPSEPLTEDDVRRTQRQTRARDREVS